MSASGVNIALRLRTAWLTESLAVLIASQRAPASNEKLGRQSHWSWAYSARRWVRASMFSPNSCSVAAPLADVLRRSVRWRCALSPPVLALWRSAGHCENLPCRW